ncbi:hypothetical protein ERJ75_000992000 [Trypanosoma vivax]|uniref:Uncharacterized protein n=1 Tax=Trypanosoma vivax (strain Y486) TaxID=1055687 RepID=G0UAM3_TRYVY|nr:hypothetical protein TRVL_03216 [Trypanosoma vivax]KAH8611649.1 hypothetical protein ERJ75_000992000 [Trypanosoma vivax]CCC52858.1 conserved hypothetical protein [Trypanosoma vivax Y486]
MPKLFVTGLCKSKPAATVEHLLSVLMPEAAHIQLLRGSQECEHKGHAYIHFSDEEIMMTVLERLKKMLPLPELPSVQLRPVNQVAATESGSFNLPPELSNFSSSQCVAVPSASSFSFLNNLEGVVARCDAGNDTVVLAFQGDEEASKAIAMHNGKLKRCIPPLLADVLAQRAGERRGRVGDTAVDEKSDDIVATYEARGFQPLSLAQMLSIIGDLVDGRGRVAVSDSAGDVAILNLPAFASALE